MFLINIGKYDFMNIAYKINKAIKDGYFEDLTMKLENKNGDYYITVNFNNILGYVENDDNIKLRYFDNEIKMNITLIIKSNKNIDFSDENFVSLRIV